MSDPLLGPRQRSDINALIDEAEITHLRHILGTDPSRCELEGYDSAAELGAARDLEEWGCNPFEED